MACVEPEDSRAHPFCAMSAEPDPNCAFGRGAYCDGTELVSCYEGYTSSRIDCADDGNMCIVDDWGTPLCAINSAKDPGCRELDGVAGNTYCDGLTLITCHGYYVGSVDSCEVACVTARPGWSFCSASSEPDPGCEADAPRPALTCPDGSRGVCASGYLECEPRASDPDADAGAPDAAL